MFDDQYIIPAFVAGTFALLILLSLTVTLVTLVRRKRREAAIRIAALELEHRNQLLVTKLDEQENTMNFISTEIHDNISQQLDLVMMNVKAAEDALNDEERRSTLANVSNNLRNASYSLNGDYIKLHGLQEVLHKELAYIQDTRQMDCSFRVEDQYRSMHPETELLVFRIAQAALHNVTKYSEASELDVLLRYQPACFMMVIADNGVGFSLDELPDKRRTLGIQSMSHRASLLDARLDIDTAPHEGCRITLEMCREELYLN